MATYFISRHKGAQEWARRNGFEHSTIMVEHFDPTVVQAGDIVIGVLPVNLAAEVCVRGGDFYSLTMNVPAHLRGTELTADMMESLGATVERFVVLPVSLYRLLLTGANQSGLNGYGYDYSND